MTTEENNGTLKEIKEQQEELTTMRSQYISELSLNPSPANALHLNELISKIDVALEVAIKVMAEVGKE
jgi:hypothetical protein